MSTLYLHIGTPKTGTSAIQKFLPLNKELLEEQGYCYPDFGYRYPGIGIYRNAHFMVYRYKSELCESEEELEAKRREEDERFIEGLDKIKEVSEIYPNIIMSDENIWNGYVKRKRFWASLKKGLTERGIDLKVIVYLRRQDLVLESYWSQQVRETMQISFQEYVNSDEYGFFKLDYYGRLKKIAKVVGKENIIVRAYEKQQYEGKGNTLISDFLKVIGLELDERYESADMIVNSSLHGRYLEIKRILNSMDCFSTKLNWAVKYLKRAQEEYESENGSLKCEYMGYDERIAFLEKYNDTNSAVAREFMDRKDGKLFRDEIHKGDGSAESYSVEEMVLICGRMLELQNEDNLIKIEHMNEKLDAMEARLERMKVSLEYAKRPLYRKIGGKIFYTIFPKKKQEAIDEPPQAVPPETKD